MAMIHPGLPFIWALPIFIMMAVMAFRGLWPRGPETCQPRPKRHHSLPIFGQIVDSLASRSWSLVTLKMVVVGIFCLVIATGLYGNPIPDRNFATPITWTIWWTLVVISVFLIGSAWCAVCPWNTIAKWLIDHRLWKRNLNAGRLNIRVPRILRNLWPALLLLIGLTWLELGLGVTADPRATAILALFVVVLAVASMAVFERTAFCRYFCPVGRTLGAYSQLAPVELRPVDSDVCASCTTLDCYHGTDTIDACPTHLTMGRFAQNTYCVSCGACALSCPHKNVSWRMRPMAAEAQTDARPHWDEAWFFLGLLSLTSFHGVSMLLGWQGLMGEISEFCGGGNWSIVGFSVAMAATMIIPVIAYAGCVWLIKLLGRFDGKGFRHIFADLSFSLLPMAFAYHIAHNLNHFVRESDGLGNVILNPFGAGAEPLSLLEQKMRHMEMLLPEHMLFALQSGIMVWGVWMAVRVLGYRANDLFGPGTKSRGLALAPMVLLILGVTGFNTYLLMQDMIMRM